MKQYLEFKGNEQYVGGDVVEYGSQASSLNLNRGPLVLKKELNSLYNYTQVKTGGMPLKWEDTELYLTGDYVSLNGVIYHALANSADELPPSASWEEVILNAATDTSGYTKFEADNLLALKYDKSNVPANPKFTDTIYDDSALSNEINLKEDKISDKTLYSGTAMSISGQTLTLQKGDGSLDMVQIPASTNTTLPTDPKQLLSNGNPLSIGPILNGTQTITLTLGDQSIVEIDVESIDWSGDLALKADKTTTYTKTEVDAIVNMPMITQTTVNISAAQTIIVDAPVNYSFLSYTPLLNLSVEVQALTTTSMTIYSTGNGSIVYTWIKTI
jgi:hypothetical protein